MDNTIILSLYITGESVNDMSSVNNRVLVNLSYLVLGRLKDPNATVLCVVFSKKLQYKDLSKLQYKDLSSSILNCGN